MIDSTWVVGSSLWAGETYEDLEQALLNIGDALFYMSISELKEEEDQSLKLANPRAAMGMKC